ncbi:MAG: hypothetical protein JXA06_04305 [Bacteroidetes bacterium]|nr:hypothetical protein [Bacteroidota bacterium]
MCYGREEKNIKDAVLAEVKKYAKLGIQDLYKLAYQAAMGNAHIMDDTVSARKYLETELASIDTLSDEPLVEYLVSDSSVARVNLRVFKKQKCNSDKLFTIMIKSASSINQSEELLQRFLDDIIELADKDCIPFEKDEVTAFFRDMKEKGFPVMHHSGIVNKEYRPAYRVLSGKVFQKYLKELQHAQSSE